MAVAIRTDGQVVSMHSGTKLSIVWTRVAYFFDGGEPALHLVDSRGILSAYSGRSETRAVSPAMCGPWGARGWRNCREPGAGRGQAASSLECPEALQ